MKAACLTLHMFMHVSTALFFFCLVLRSVFFACQDLLGLCAFVKLRPTGLRVHGDCKWEPQEAASME